MIQYLASDIIKMAKIVGNVRNINMTNFEICNNFFEY